MRAWAVSIGSEIMSGQITDTNATFLAQECVAAGIDFIRVTQVGDDMASLVETLRLALSQADVVICTGGVGPTDDDLTREAIAEVAGETPETDPDLLRELRAFFANRGQDMPERNAKQAWVIPSSRTLPNPVGTAPGWLVTVDRDGLQGTIIAMPGVPREMYRMWREQALPALQEQAGSRAIRSVTLKTLGIGESAAEDRIHDLILRGEPVIATYAKDDGVHVRVTATAESAEAAERSLELGIAGVQAELGEYIWGRDADTLPAVLRDALERAGATLAVMEMGSGGAFCGMLTSVPSLDQTHPLVDGRVLPLDLSLAQPEAMERATGAASRLRAEANATIGVAIVVFGGFDERQVLHGMAAVAIDTGDDASEVTSVGLRATIDDVHRRSAMHAADRLRRLLARRQGSSAASA
jgi:nicotinamide-nucleotide amidase